MPRFLFHRNRKPVSQADVPAYSLEQALRVARAIGENYAFQPAKPLDVAAALNMSPGSGHFRMMCGSAIGYGLTVGGYNSSTITVTPLAQRILEPTNEGDPLEAKREAVLKPRVIHQFLSRYNGHKLPREEIGRNVLTQELEVPRESTKRVWDLIIESARSVGFLRVIKDATYVDLQGVNLPSEPDLSEGTDAAEVVDKGVFDKKDVGSSTSEFFRVAPPTPPGDTAAEQNQPSRIDNARVFITHGKNRSFVEPLKVLLGHGGFEAVVATEKETVSQPVPDKIINAMRSCGAAIIHIDAERTLIDPNQQTPEVVLNPNVLIEIGAAMALYERRFILLVKQGINLPSNLQGLYQVRYNEDDKLDFDTTIRLLSAIKDIRNQASP